MNFCWKVTDAGIEALCGGSTDVEQKRLQGQKGQCKSLRKLSIDPNSIPQKGMQSALKNLPELRILDHPHVFEALAEMHRSNQQRPLPKYNLTYLRFNMRIGSLHLPISY